MRSLGTEGLSFFFFPMKISFFAHTTNRIFLLLTYGTSFHIIWHTNLALLANNQHNVPELSLSLFPCPSDKHTHTHTNTNTHKPTLNLTFNFTQWNEAVCAYSKDIISFNKQAIVAVFLVFVSLFILCVFVAMNIFGHINDKRTPSRPLGEVKLVRA